MLFEKKKKLKLNEARVRDVLGPNLEKKTITASTNNQLAELCVFFYICHLFVCEMIIWILYSLKRKINDSSEERVERRKKKLTHDKGKKAHDRIMIEWMASMKMINNNCNILLFPKWSSVSVKCSAFQVTR